MTTPDDCAGPCTIGGIFRLLFHDFERMIGTMPQDDSRRLATLWRVTVEGWLRREGLSCVRQNHKPKVSTNYPEKWSLINFAAQL